MPSSSSSSCSSCSCSCSCSCSSCSCSSCSSCCSSSSSSAVARVNEMGLLAQDANNYFLVDRGSAYDAYGRRIHVEDQIHQQIDFDPASQITPGGIKFAYLCIRRLSTYKVHDYQQNAQTGLPSPTKINESDTELYLALSINEITDTEGNTIYYPPKDDEGLYDGLVLAKVYDGTALNPPAPDMKYRTYLVVADGVPYTLTGFPLGINVTDTSAMSVLSTTYTWSSCSSSSSSDINFSSSSCSSS